MKNKRYSDAQIMGILKQAEGGVPVSELCREHGMSNASFYKWRAKFGGMDASMVLSRNCAAPLTAYYAQKENNDGNETYSRI